MIDMNLAVGVGSLAFAFAQLVWFVRANARPHFAIQALILGEIGVMFVLIALFPRGPARIAVSAFGFLAVGSSVMLLLKLLRAERRGGAAPNRQGS